MDVDQLVREAARKVAGDPEAAALFECLRPLFLNPDHDVGSMLRACGASRAVQDRLASILGPLKPWVTRLRMTQAARRIRDTGETNEIIARRLGYSKRGFRRAFQDCHGVTPQEMRRRLQAPRPAAPATDRPADDNGERTERATRQSAAPPEQRSTPRARALRRRRRLALGLLDPTAAGERRADLRRRYPRLDRKHNDAPRQRNSSSGPAHPAAEVEPLPTVLPATRDHLEDVVAEVVIDRIFEEPNVGQRFSMLEAVRFASAVPFHQFFDHCMRIAPADPERAVASAELGVRWVELHREMIGDRAGEWQAVAWTYLGRVHAYLGDCGSAERCLTAARAELGDGPWRTWPEAEIRRVEGMVRKQERRWDQAVRAVDRAVELTRQRPEGDLDRWQTLFQRLELAAAMDDAEAALAFATELEQLLDAWNPVEGRDESLTLWRAFVSYQRGKAYAAAGDDPHAEHFLRHAIGEITADPGCDDDARLGVLLALALHELSRVGSRIGRPGDDEFLLRQALDRYRWLGTPLLQAAAEAELALLCALRGDWAEARQLAEAASQFLDDLPFHREAWHAARRLRALVEEGERPKSDLREILMQLRHDLDLVAWEIPAPQAEAATRARTRREGLPGEEETSSGVDGSPHGEEP